MKKSHLASTFALAVVLTGTAFAAGHIDEDVAKAMEARQSHMTLYSFNLGTLGGMAQEKIPYDAQAAATAAADLAALANISQTGYWIEGSDSSVEGSRAKPEIWTDAAGFAAKRQELATASTALAAAAGDGLDALKAAFGPVGGTCGSCHRGYRVSDN
ncbi:c-type cytochrome [Yoonia sp.]|uniref:c-type cytochrome n=1 Tax=Yoonia sp. TaxID=2212373 RepID=UPI003F6AAB86